ncbi:hypothetical protein AAVH_20556, partial [Aphelenchoides avenae]
MSASRIGLFLAEASQALTRGLFNAAGPRKTSNSSLFDITTRANCSQAASELSTLIKESTIFRAIGC